MPYFDNHIDNTGQYGEVIFMTVFLVLIIVGGLCAVAITKAAKSMDRHISAQLDKAPSCILEKVAIVKEDLLYLGTESEIVITDIKVIANSSKYQFVCLCKTRSGNWFMLNFDFDPRPTFEEATSIDVHPISICDAKSHLSANAVEYKKHFGDIKIA